MAFTKITDTDITTYGVQSQPNKLTGSALQNKQAFDKLVTEAVKAKFNALIDELVAITAAAQIGVDVDGLSSDKVADALAEVKNIAQQAQQAQITDGSITTVKLAGGNGVPGAVTAVKLGTDIRPVHVGIKSGTDVPTTATLNNGEIYFMYTEEE